MPARRASAAAAAGLFDLGFCAYVALQVQASAAAGARCAVDSGWDPNRIAGAGAAATATPGIAASAMLSQFCACPATGSLAAVNCAGRCPDDSLPSLYGLVNAQIQYSRCFPIPGCRER